jgi:hypothetical protein
VSRTRQNWHDWPFEPLPVLRALSASSVEYVLIGGLAAVLHGSPLPTYDIDITPSATTKNRQRLSEALAELGAKEPLLDGTASTLTSFGYLDLHFLPAGFAGYADVRRHAVWVELEPSLRVLTLPLRDIIRSRLAAGDNRQLPALEAALELS